MKKIDEVCLLNLFENVFKYEDFKDLVNVKKESLEEMEEAKISLLCTSSQADFLKDFKLNDEIEEFILAELKDIILLKILNKIYESFPLESDLNKIKDLNFDKIILCGGSIAFLLNRDINIKVDLHKKWTDETFIITQKNPVTFTYSPNDISIQVIQEAGFSPNVSLKFKYYVAISK